MMDFKKRAEELASEHVESYHVRLRQYSPDDETRANSFVMGFEACLKELEKYREQDTAAGGELYRLYMIPFGEEK